MLNVRHLNKNYGDFKALQDVNFKLEKGQILGLVGENGAGKSTIIKILSGLIEPSSGEVEYFGKDFFTNSGKIKRKIGYLPETDSLYENMNPLEYLGFFASLYDIPSDKAEEKARELINMLNLPENKPIGGFSKGMKRKVSIARSLIHEPEILINDEPTGGLDPSTSLFISEFMKNLKKEDKGILFSAHNMYYVEAVCDEIIVLKGGRILYYGTVDALRQTKKYILHYQENSKVESFETSDVGELNSFMKSLTASGGKIVKIDSQVARLEDLYFSILEESSS